MTVSVQDTVGSSIAFAAIVHLGATVPARLLRCILNCEDMVTLRTAQFDVTRHDGGTINPPTAPGLGLTVHEEVLGSPAATWTV